MSLSKLDYLKQYTDMMTPLFSGYPFQGKFILNYFLNSNKWETLTHFTSTRIYIFDVHLQVTNDYSYRKSRIVTTFI